MKQVHSALQTPGSMTGEHVRQSGEDSSMSEGPSSSGGGDGASQPQQPSPESVSTSGGTCKDKEDNFTDDTERTEDDTDESEPIQAQGRTLAPAQSPVPSRRTSVVRFADDVDGTSSDPDSGSEGDIDSDAVVYGEEVDGAQLMRMRLMEIEAEEAQAQAKVEREPAGAARGSEIGDGNRTKRTDRWSSVRDSFAAASQKRRSGSLGGGRDSCRESFLTAAMSSDHDDRSDRDYDTEDEDDGDTENEAPVLARAASPEKIGASMCCDGVADDDGGDGCDDGPFRRMHRGTARGRKHQSRPGILQRGGLPGSSSSPGVSAGAAEGDRPRRRGSGASLPSCSSSQQRPRRRGSGASIRSCSSSQHSGGGRAVGDDCIVIDEGKICAIWEELYEMIGGDEFFWLESDSNQWTWKKFVQILNECGDAYAEDVVGAATEAVADEDDEDRACGDISGGRELLEENYRIAASMLRRRRRRRRGAGPRDLPPPRGIPTKVICSTASGNSVTDQLGGGDYHEGDDDNSDDTGDISASIAKAFRRAVTERRGGILNGTLAHYACRLNPPNEVLEAFFRASPRVAFMKDDQQFLPLEYVYEQLIATLEERYTVLVDCRWDNFIAVFSVVRHDPQLARRVVETRGGNWDDTLLHHVVWQSDPPLHVVDALLRASPGSVTLGNKFGSTPLHHAVQQNGSKPDLLQKLIDADPGRTTLSARGQYGYTPLHLAAKPGMHSLDVVRLILLSASAPTVSAGHLVTITDKNDETALAQAVQRGAPTEVIEELLRADEKKATLTMKDCFGMRPLCQAIKRGLPPETVEVLVDHSPYELMDILLRKAIGRKQARPGITAKEARLISLGRMSSMRSLADSTNDENDDPNGYPSSDGVVDVSIRYFPSLAKYVSTCKQCQDMLNRRSADRIFTAVVMADFYVYVALVWGFSVSSHVAVRSWAGLVPEEESTTGWYNALYCLSAYLALREVLQWKTQGINWLLDVWNWLDVANLVLVAMSAHLMKSGVESDATRYLIMGTGAIVWMMLLTFLRSTFLPFSVFVTGINNIIWKVIPFLVSSAIVLGAFVHMYYVDSVGTDRCQGLLSADDGSGRSHRGEDSKFCTYEGTFVKIYHMFVGGVDEYLFLNGAVEERNWMKEENDMRYSTLFVSVLFGLLVQILLLNVIIVIVNESWDDVSRHGAEVFWEHRLSFLSEVKTVGIGSVGATTYGAWSRTTKILDRVAQKLTKSVVLGSRADEEDLNMFDYMTSLQDDGFLMKTCEEWSLAKYERRRYTRRTIIFLKALLCWILFVLICVICLVGGLVTFGVLWPRSFRHYLFGRNAINCMEVPGQMSNEIRLIGQKFDLLEQRQSEAVSTDNLSKHTSADLQDALEGIRSVYDENLREENAELKASLSELKNHYEKLAQREADGRKRLEAKVDALLSALLSKPPNGVMNGQHKV